ncbi:lysostaphin resistance A-like protein [Desulfothermobacter acidiphilus]|uniref:CPBP family intramembrane glutamic endopeptidase n=1 Tax=Desulfothermobacter acidiphilus TaxID=1938353 RepID=UPI003F89AE08
MEEAKSHLLPPLWVLYLGQALLGALAFAAFWWVHTRYHLPWEALTRVGPPGQVLAFGIGGGAGLIAFVAATYFLLLRRLPERFWFDPAVLALTELSGLHLFFLLLLTALIEETLFRAALQNLLLLRLGSVPVAIGAAAALFTGAHLRYLARPLLAGMALILGGALGWLYWYTGSLWTAVIAHFLYDLLAVQLLKKGWLLPKEAD